MIRHAPSGSVVATALLCVAAFACSGRAAPAGEGGAPRTPPASSDPEKPLVGLHLGADAVAARLGSFGWEGSVTWSVEKPGAAPVHATERHRLRQLATGDFESLLDVDPGGGAGSETGRSLVSKDGMVYARGKWAPFRERPSDRGQDARRSRDDSFRIAADVADLLGPALALRPAGSARVLGRPARRLAVSLGSAAAPGSTEPAESKDPDTVRRRAFLDGRVPTSAEGELIVDEATGAPLAVSLRAAFTQRDDATLKAAIAVEARITALGREVGAIHAPRGALPDDRKPKGVARALEAAGLRKKGPPTPDERDEDLPDEAP